jgi:NitT/TauT family transport system permease protein
VNTAVSGPPSSTRRSAAGAAGFFTLSRNRLIARFALLARHAGVTLGEVGVGLAAAVGGGAVLAVAMASMPFLHRGLYPLLAFLQAVPKVTVAPLFLIWLGYGLGSKVLMVFLIAFFPIVVNLTTGLLQVDADLLRLMRSYLATGFFGNRA